MLLRHALDGTIAITQPHHAWLAGELAQAWGGQGFRVPEPRDALVRAAALHDIGWLDWERAPRLDPSTGLPTPFDKVEATVHTGLWRSGVEAAAVYGALPALHVSRHGVAIYDMTFDPATARPEQAAAVEAYRAWQDAYQAAEVARLARDPKLAPWLLADHLALTRAFIVAVDTLSLDLCWGIGEGARVRDVPHASGFVEIALTPVSSHEVALEPWPFAVRELAICIEGKRVAPVPDQAALDELMRNADTIVSRTMLRPA